MASLYERARALAAAERDKPNERFIGLKPIIKTVLPRPTFRGDAAALRAELQGLQVSAVDPEDTDEIPAPITSFEEGVGGNAELLREFSRNGFRKPSPIQAQMWPILLQGKDCIGISQTGSGKTLAFLVPALLHIEAQLSQYSSEEQKPCPFVLIVTPTRELAQQIEGEVRKYHYKRYKSVALYGGANRCDQIKSCAHGAEIIIATPGRLADLATAGTVRLESVTFVVLDEADRMLDMGFEHDIRRIMLDIRPDRVTVLTSATWPETVRELSHKYLHRAAMVVVGTLDLSACATVTQFFEYFEEEEDRRLRLRELITLLSQRFGRKLKLIIFVSKKIYADDVASDLCMAGINSQALHGGRSQEDRENSLKEFRAGRVRVLIATDLASRGIDVPDITHVINYDFPSDIEEYVHRVGRTGRAGKSGEAMTFLTYRNRDSAAKLIDILEKSHQCVPERLRQMAKQWRARVEHCGVPRGRFQRNRY